MTIGYRQFNIKNITFELILEKALKKCDPQVSVVTQNIYDSISLVIRQCPFD